MNIGKEWHWPNDHELIEWEAKVRGRNGNRRLLSPGHTLMLIRAVRSQRKCIEKLAKLLAAEQSAEPTSEAHSAVRQWTPEQEEMFEAMAKAERRARGNAGEVPAAGTTPSVEVPHE